MVTPCELPFLRPLEGIIARTEEARVCDDGEVDEASSTNGHVCGRLVQDPRVGEDEGQCDARDDKQGRQEVAKVERARGVVCAEVVDAATAREDGVGRGCEDKDGGCGCRISAGPSQRRGTHEMDRTHRRIMAASC